MYSAAAVKSFQSCPTLCDPRDGSPPGSTVPGILQARTLERVTISFSNAWKWKVKVKLLSRVRLSQTSPIVKKKNPSTLLSLPVNTLLLSYPTEVCCKSCYTCYFSFISHLILNPITSSFLPPQLWNYFLYIYQSFVNEIDKHLVMRKDVLIQYWVKKVAYKA